MKTLRTDGNTLQWLGEGRMNWDSSTDMYSLSHVKQMVAGTCYIAQGAQLDAL